jgi:hypothetical protein
MLGILLSAAGGAAIGFGMPIKELSHGTTLILGGVFALVGGLLLVGLSAVVSELARVTAALKVPQTQPQQPQQPQVQAAAARAALPAPPAETVAREPVKDPAQDIELPAPGPAAPIPSPAPSPAPTPAAGPDVEVSASAIERLRSSIPRPDKVVPEAADAIPLSPNGQHAAHHVEPPPLQVAPVLRSAGAVQHTPAQHAPQQQEAFDSLWPKRPGREGQADPRLEVARAPALPTAAHPAAEAEVAPVSRERTVAILKSGVVDGMAYTLYADGSIEAQLPQGTVRFGSIAELRAHIENSA